MSAEPDIVWDHLVIGAGSAGCVLAERLSARGHRVLLVEAGGSNRHPFITMPRGFGRINGNPRFNWIYRAEPTGPAKRREYWLRGRGLGGSGAVNGSVWVRGLPQDFDDLEEAGAPGWGWDEMKRAFDAIEGGEPGRPPFGISPHPGRHALCDAMIAGGAELGLPVANDINGLTGAGIGYQPRSIRQGRRRNAATDFLPAALARPGFRLLTGHEILRLVFDGRRCTGAVAKHAGGEIVLRARHVTLSAGALNSPRLLMLSGIGSAPALSALGLEVVHNAPEVGQNLREHRLLSLQFRLAGGSDNRAFRSLGLAYSAARYYLGRGGPLAQAAFEVGGFVNILGGARPDAQIGMAPLSLDKSTQRMKVEGTHGALCGGYVMRPESTGSLSLGGPAADAPLRIDPNYLSAESDRAISIGVVRFIRALFKTPALARFAPQETLPGPGTASEEDILEAFHCLGQAGFHAAGTCRMGSDALSVVDPTTRVRGVEGLSVADLSVLPRLISGNTNAPAMAIGWRAAELLG